MERYAVQPAPNNEGLYNVVDTKRVVAVEMHKPLDVAQRLADKRNQGVKAARREMTVAVNRDEMAEQALIELSRSQRGV